MIKAIEFLNRLKERPVIPLGEEPEERSELLSRIDYDGHASEIKRTAYFELGQSLRVSVRLPLHFFAVGGDKTVRFFWLAPPRAFACKLTKEEVSEWAILFRVPEFIPLDEREGRFKGYGDGFELADLLPGESFIVGNTGQACLVGRDQDDDRGILVWTEPDSIDARRRLWRNDLRVFAVTAAQARRIERRIAARERRKRA